MICKKDSEQPIQLIKTLLTLIEITIDQLTTLAGKYWDTYYL